MKTNVPSTHCANCPFIQSIVPTEQLWEDGLAEVVARGSDTAAAVVGSDIAVCAGGSAVLGPSENSQNTTLLAYRDSPKAKSVLRHGAKSCGGV